MHTSFNGLTRLSTAADLAVRFKAKLLVAALLSAKG
jgi:hypothetical protein